MAIHASHTMSQKDRQALKGVRCGIVECFIDLAHLLVAVYKELE